MPKVCPIKSTIKFSSDRCYCMKKAHTDRANEREMGKYIGIEKRGTFACSTRKRSYISNSKINITHSPYRANEAFDEWAGSQVNYGHSIATMTREPI